MVLSVAVETVMRAAFPEDGKGRTKWGEVRNFFFALSSLFLSLFFGQPNGAW